MTMTDPIADMLTRIRNANTAHFDTVTMPGSKLKESLAAILESEGYIAGYEVSERPGKPIEVNSQRRRQHRQYGSHPRLDQNRLGHGPAGKVQVLGQLRRR